MDLLLSKPVQCVWVTLSCQIKWSIPKKMWTDSYFTKFHITKIGQLFDTETIHSNKFTFETKLICAWFTKQFNRVLPIASTIFSRYRFYTHHSYKQWMYLTVPTWKWIFVCIFLTNGILKIKIFWRENLL